MKDRTLLIIGGGLAGLSAGCYALRNGYRVTLVEHNLALGGVCTAWHRGPYLMDGCIHWLTGGPFTRLYDELGITTDVQFRTLNTWQTYRNAKDATSIAFTRDLDAMVADLSRLSPPDVEELRRMRQGARDLVQLDPSLEAPQLLSLRERIKPLWDARGALGTMVHFRKPVGEWAREHLVSPTLQRAFTSLVPDASPTIVLLMMLGYLEKGFLSRPVGGSAAFRDALERTFRTLGGTVRLHQTVDEILVRDHRAVGVRLADGTLMNADVVLSTSSAPETVLRLLGGRYDPEPTRGRLETWKLFEPVVLASFGVQNPYESQPNLLTLDGLSGVEVGNRFADRIQVRVCNDDPCYAPKGQTVVQVMAPTDYEYWATRGTRYHEAKSAVADALARALEPTFHEFSKAVRVTDVVTPLTFWSQARSWRGAYEGWLPTPEAMGVPVEKTLPGLKGFYMAGQWMEPGGGVPMALMSGRQAVQLLCADEGSSFACETRAM